QFYAELRERLGLHGPEWDSQMDRTRWPELKEQLAAVIRRRTRDEWCDLLEGTDTCFAPVLSLAEAPEHTHNQERGTFTQVAGVVQPTAAPRYSRTPGAIRRPPPHAGQHTDELLAELGLEADAIDALREVGAVA
ncbi:MAG: CoA transferase, partial [Acidimicrobiaceae bacterium]|nr:CoA transferase [Acidimicrobiaceae bacterium]